MNILLLIYIYSELSVWSSIRLLVAKCLKNTLENIRAPLLVYLEKAHWIRLDEVDWINLF